MPWAFSSVMSNLQIGALAPDLIVLSISKDCLAPSRLSSAVRPAVPEQISMAAKEPGAEISSATCLNSVGALWFARAPEVATGFGAAGVVRCSSPPSALV